MKRFRHLTLIVFLLGTKQFFAQSLSIDDLTKILNTPIEKIETFLIDKKFEFIIVETNKISKVYRYISKRNTSDANRAYAPLSKGSWKDGAISITYPTIAYAHLSKYFYKDGIISVTYRTIEAEVYKKIKSSLEVRGFKFTTEQTDGDKLRRKYESTKYKLEIWQGVESEVTFYEIDIEGK